MTVPQGVRFFVIQNRQGKTRLSRWYVPVEYEEKAKTESEVHRLVTSRDSKFTNFVEVSPLPSRLLAGSLLCVLFACVFACVVEERECVFVCEGEGGRQPIPPLTAHPHPFCFPVPDVQAHLSTIRGAVFHDGS